MTELVDYQYLNILHDIYYNGVDCKDRTDVGMSRQLFKAEIVFDTKDKYIPFIQTRKFGPKTSFLEWIWMMNGMTDSKWLEERGVAIWKGNTTRDFLDSRGLYGLPEGDIGKSYGYQLRNFGGVDQLKKVYERLQTNSRRGVVSLWNPAELDEAPLEPCAYDYCFTRIGNTLNLRQTMRSADVLYGVPYNMGFATYWLFAFARALGLEAGQYWLTMDNAHIYANQLGDVGKMLSNGVNKDLKTPQLKINKKLNSLEDILELDYSYLEIKDWVRGADIGSAKMAT